MTPELKKAILDHYVESYNLAEAARRVGITRTRVYYWIDKDPDFARDYAAAQEAVADGLEEVAWQRARTKSDLLMIFLLKGLRRWKYADAQVSYQQIDIKRGTELLAQLAQISSKPSESLRAVSDKAGKAEATPALPAGQEATVVS